MNVVVIGPRGKMGRLIAQEANERADMHLVAGIGPKGRPYIGKDLGQVAKLGEDIGAPVLDELQAVISDCDVIIDFSTKEMSLEVLDTAVAYRKAVVCGTTGFTEEEMASFKKAAEVIPVLYAANTSKLVNVMVKLLELATTAIGNETDIEILEMHDRWKTDAPSGTSKELGEAIAAQLGRQLKDVAVYGREGSGSRQAGTIGYHSLRAGDIPSSHTVFFGGLGERLEITHHSYNWECFAKGACDCAAYLTGKKPGFYTIKDVLAI